MLTIIVLVMLLAVMLFFVALTTKKWKNQGAYDTWEMGVGLSWIGVIGVVAACAITFGCQYNATISMPLNLEALNVTIEQQSEYITLDGGTVAQGLEGFEIKREIQQTIRDRNMLIAEIEYRQRSLWYLFKPRMTTGI